MTTRALALLFFLVVSPACARDAAVETLFQQRVSGRWTRFEARVEKLLRDDVTPPRHQRFIVRTGLGQSVLVTHNIDLAPRLELAEGDRVVVRGKYVWNPKGGLVHWTHRDPRGAGPHGYVKNERTGVRSW